MISEKKISEVRKLISHPTNWKYQDIAHYYKTSHSTARRYVRLAKAEKKRFPNILLLDIETAPLEVYAWEIGSRVSLGHYQIKHEWFILSWAGKWLLKDGILSDVVTPEEAIAKDDARICESLWSAVEESHIVIAHNAIRFDVRKINARFLTNVMLPPSPYQVIDTLKQAQRMAAFSSHKLDHLTRLFGLSRKDDTDFALWVACCEGSKMALDRMLKYNKSDIRALESLYLYLRPYMTSHPNLGLYCNHEESVCPSCGDSDLDWTINHYYTPAGKYRAFRCVQCGAIGRDRFNVLTKDEREELTISTAR